MVAYLVTHRPERSAFYMRRQTKLAASPGVILMRRHK